MIKDLVISILVTVIIFLIAPFEGACIAEKVFFAMSFTVLLTVGLRFADYMIEGEDEDEEI